MSETATDVSIDQLIFATIEGEEITPEEWRGETVLLVFLRWLG